MTTKKIDINSLLSSNVKECFDISKRYPSLNVILYLATKGTNRMHWIRFEDEPAKEVDGFKLEVLVMFKHGCIVQKLKPPRTYVK